MFDIQILQAEKTWIRCNVNRERETRMANENRIHFELVIFGLVTTPLIVGPFTEFPFFAVLCLVLLMYLTVAPAAAV